MERLKQPSAETISQAVEKKVASWKEGPVVLASGSSYKLEQLKSLGMKDVSAIPAPEIEESQFFGRYEDGKGRTDEMVAALVARTKVKYAIANGAPADSLVCGFDTVVLKVEDWGDNRKNTYLQKPETREQAKEGLVDFFVHLATQKRRHDDSYADMKELVEMHPKFNKRRDELENTMDFGNPRPLILVATGMAVRAPGKGDDIDIVPTAMRLQSNTLYAYSENSPEELKKRCEELAEEALVIMGDRWSGITTGIDYSDPQIIGLLDLQEIPVVFGLPPTEEGVLKGMPKEAFERMLRGMAEEEVTKT